MTLIHTVYLTYTRQAKQITLSGQFFGAKRLFWPKTKPQTTKHRKRETHKTNEHYHAIGYL